MSNTAVRPIEPGIAREPKAVGAYSVSLPEAVQVLSRARRRILITGAISLVLAGTLAFLIPTKFTASASFVPPGANTDSSAAAVMGQLASLGGASGLLEGKSRGELYAAILKSHTVAREIVKRLGLMQVYKAKKESVAEGMLESRSVFTVDTKSTVVTILATDTSPERAKDMAAAYLQVLQDTSASLALTESSQRRLFYEQRLAKEKDDLAAAEVALKQTEEQTGLVNPGGQTDINIQALAQLQAQITNQQAQLAALLHDKTEENPDVLRARSQIASLQAKAGEMENGAAKGFGKLSTAQVPGLELEYIRKARDVKYHETLFDILAKQYEAARLDESKDSPLQVLDTPVVPDTKSGPPRFIMIVVGTLLGLVGASAWQLWKASRPVIDVPGAIPF